MLTWTFMALVALVAALLALAGLFLRARRLWRLWAVRRLLRDEQYHRIIEAQRRRNKR